MALAATPALAPSPVLVTRAHELRPAGAPGLLAWTEAPTPYSTRVNAYAMWAGRPRSKVNPPGTRGLTYSGAIDGTRLVYEQRASLGSPGDLKLLDLVTGVRSDPPPGVNTRNPEQDASLSGDWLLFTRVSGYSHRIILFNLVTREARQLDFSRGRRLADTGSVRGDYASWMKCASPSRCSAYVYDIRTRAKLRVPNPYRRSQYAVSVTAAGVVYFAESRDLNCGRGLALWRYPLGGSRTRLLRLPRGRGVANTSPVANADGSTTLFFDRLRCSTDAADILKLELRG